MLTVVYKMIAHMLTSYQCIKVYDDMKAKDSVVGEQASAYHGSLVDLSERGRLAVLEFTASSVAVLEREQKCKVGIRRYGRKDNSVAFRFVILSTAYYFILCLFIKIYMDSDLVLSLPWLCGTPCKGML